jgi:hypothetical protein
MQSNATKFYQDQAAQARAKCESEKLANVRDNLNRCADAWDKLALRSRRSDQLRADEAARKQGE